MLPDPHNPKVGDCFIAKTDHNCYQLIRLTGDDTPCGGTPVFKSDIIEVKPWKIVLHNGASSVGFDRYTPISAEEFEQIYSEVRRNIITTNQYIRNFKSCQE